jgi:hypothetical protein
MLKRADEELVSGPPGPDVSGGCIFDTHDLHGRHRPDARPLTRSEWLPACRQLAIEGHAPEASLGISPEGRA